MMHAAVVKKLTADTDGDARLFDDASRERNISRDHDITGFEQLDDPVVGDVSAFRNGQQPNQIGGRNAHGLIGNQNQLNLKSSGGSIKNLPDRHRAGIRIDPDAKWRFVVCIQDGLLFSLAVGAVARVVSSSIVFGRR